MKHKDGIAEMQKNKIHLNITISCFKLENCTESNEIHEIHELARCCANQNKQQKIDYQKLIRINVK